MEMETCPKKEEFPGVGSGQRRLFVSGCLRQEKLLRFPNDPNGGFTARSSTDLLVITCPRDLMCRCGGCSPCAPFRFIMGCICQAELWGRGGAGGAQMRLAELGSHQRGGAQRGFAGVLQREYLAWGEGGWLPAAGSGVCAPLEVSEAVPRAAPHPSTAHTHSVCFTFATLGIWD